MVKLKASLIVESMISMIIIISCMGIATMVYVKLLSSDKQKLELESIFILNSIAEETKREKKYVDEDIEFNNFLIEKKVTLYDGSENCYLLSLIAFNQDRKHIKTRNELIFAE